MSNYNDGLLNSEVCMFSKGNAEMFLSFEKARMRLN